MSPMAPDWLSCLRLRKRAGRLEGPPLDVAAIDDQIAMKLAAGRQQDLADVEVLRAIKRLLREEKRKTSCCTFARPPFLLHGEVVIPSEAGRGAPAVAAALVPAQPRDLGHCRGLVLLATTATLAQASSSEPPTGTPEAGNIGGSDQSTPSATNTDYTPRAQDGAGAGWTRVAGADFGATGSQITPFDADFYSVRFPRRPKRPFRRLALPKPKGRHRNLSASAADLSLPSATGTAREPKRRPAARRLSPKARLRRSDRLDPAPW